MSDFSYNSELFTNYLLGRLPEPDCERLEENYFCDNEVFLSLLDAKDQLISDYLNEKLQPEDRKCFEQHFLNSPSRKQEVELAASFHHSLIKPRQKPTVFASKTVPSQPLKTSGVWQTHKSLICMGVVLFLFVLCFMGIWLRPNPLALPQPVEQSTTVLPGLATVSLSLRPTSLRSSKRNTTAEVGNETKTVELHLEVSKEIFPNYQGSLYIRGNEKEEEVLSNDSLHATKSESGPPMVIWKLPADKLQVQDYRARLNGISQGSAPIHIGNYDFEVRPPSQENSLQSK
jgi:hypothetical protein